VLLVATGALIAGYTLLYAGVRGSHWRQPWALLIGTAAPATPPGTPAHAPANTVPGGARGPDLTPANPPGSLVA
jgi:hypothetical protein